MVKFSLFLLLLTCICSHVESAKIIIVGAGISGIGAATRLIEKNVTDFIILEAEKSLGGRIKSVFLLDGEEGGFVDIGAEFLLAQKGDIAFDFAEQDLKLIDPKKRQKNYYSDGKLVDSKIVSDLVALTDKLKKDYDGKKPISVADAFSVKLDQNLLKEYAKTNGKSQQLSDYTSTCEKAFLYRQGAFSWKTLLLNDHFQENKGDQVFVWNGKGYKSLIDRVMTKFGDEHRLRLYPIYYETTVENINWGKGGKVQLHTQGGQKYEAEHVIFTASAGVLKTKHEKMFTPKLPAAKITAINDIGYETNMKIALQYSQKWWTDDINEFVFTFSDNDDKELSKTFYVGSQKGKKSWLSACSKVATVDGLPNTLLAWLVGPQVPEIEKLDIQTLREGLFVLTKRFLGNDYNVTAPQLIVPSNWHSNSNFAGVHSHETIGSANRKHQVQEVLAEPLLSKDRVPVVLFAGEHTNKIHFGTVHGALESGYRAADDLVNYLHKN